MADSAGCVVIVLIGESSGSKHVPWPKQSPGHSGPGGLLGPPVRQRTCINETTGSTLRDKVYRF